MCLKHKGGVNHSAVARRHKSQSHTHTQNVFTSILSAYSAAQRQQLRITLPRSYSHAGRERGCKSGLCSEQEEAAPALYWSFEEKYKQANPLYLTQCVYPTVDAIGAERSKEAVEGTVIVGGGFSAHFSNRSGEEPAPRSLHFLWREFAICTQTLYWFSSSTIGSSQVSALFAIE